MTKKKEVYELLKKVFPGQADDGEDYVQDEYFRTDDLKIYYYDVSIYRGNGQYNLRGDNRTPLMEIKNKTNNREKCFIFSKSNDYFENFLISIEVESIRKEDLQTYTLGFDKNFKDIKNDGDTIIRKHFGDEAKNNYSFYIVFIPINEGNNYSAIKHYIASSDNRTYNTAVFSVPEYIEIPKQDPDNIKDVDMPHNLLVSGAPGTGKSHFLKDEVLKAGKSIIESFEEIHKTDTPDEEKRKQDAETYFTGNYVTRVTFYEDYSYENFVGCYKPVPCDEDMTTIEYDGKAGSLTGRKITYEYVAGPFIDTLVKSLDMKNAGKAFFLIIEEINRAKAASVFGDMFQLLDRDADGKSVYDIKPDPALQAYLELKLGLKENDTIRLPSNMYIWATMNSADQGVLPLDSAFKRRWASLYMDIVPDVKNICGESIYLQYNDTEKKYVLWENLRTRINKVIQANGFDEDRCIGSWFFSKTEFQQIKKYFEADKETRKNMPNPLVDKLLYYLRQDVFRRNASAMFKEKDDKGIDRGITMSSIRTRIRDGERIDSILNIEKLEENVWKIKTDDASAQSNN